MKTFRRMQEAQAKGKASHQEFDMLFSLADFRAKRILLEERGLTGLSRFTCTDEMRTKPAILFTRGHFKVLADGRTPDAKKQRTFVPSAVCAAVCGSEPAPSHCRSATWVSCCWLQSAWFGTTRSSSLQRRPRASFARSRWKTPRRRCCC